MFISKMSLPRRTFLRGMGVTVALPLLEAMVPAVTALAATDAAPVRRFGSVMVPMGAVMANWTPQTAGADFAFSPILKPLEPFRDRVVVMSGLSSTTSDAGHAPGPICFLSGVPGKKTEAEDIRNGITLDQVIAKQIGQTTTFPSLEVATEDFTGFVGACDNGWSCAYLNTISWASPTAPLPMEINPRVVFERMFGGTGTLEQRMERLRVGKSVLDSIIPEATRLQNGLGPHDRARLTEYLDNVRELERRLERSEKNAATDVTTDSAPVGIPTDFEEHVGLMFDLLAVGFQTDVTRVFSFMMARELSQRTYPQLNVLDPHHATSHHRNEPALLAANTRVQIYHYTLFARFLDKLKSTPDGDGSLLDHSVIMYGSGMSDSNLHSHHGLPLVVVGGGAGSVQGNRHVVNPADTPIANLHLSLAQKFGCALESFGASTGAVAL
jgi:hypothetical protein